MRAVAVIMLSALLANTLMAQVRSIDVAEQTARRLINANQADSLYALMAPSFQQVIGRADFNAFITETRADLGTWQSSTDKRRVGAAWQFKALFEKAPLAFTLSLDQQGRFEAFGFEAYEEQKTEPTADAPFPTNNSLSTTFDRQLDSLTQAFAKRTRAVGLVVGVLDGTTKHVYGYGETARGNGQLPGEQTTFEIGSITKTMTATLLAKAVLAGKLALDAPINTYLPDSIPPLQRDGVAITARMLANHTSGLPRLPDDIIKKARNANDPYATYDQRALFSYLRRATLSTKPGTAYAYSNLGAGLLGTLLERVWQKPYPQLLAEHLFEPLRMTQSSVATPDKVQPTMAQGYDEQNKPTTTWTFQAMAGAGSVRSTVGDLLLYAQAQLSEAGNPLWSAIELTQQPTFAPTAKPLIGLGWHFTPKGWLWHNGGTGGFSSFLGVDRATKRAFVVLVNKSGAADELAAALQKIVANR